jgi:hypothetical protein
VPGHEHIVFIAYARSEGLEIDRLVDRLRSRGISTRWDVEDIAVGKDWRETLKYLIDGADTIIFIISPRSMTSQWCQWEVEYAASRNKRILPVLMKPVNDDVIPPTLARLQYLVLTDPNDDRAFNTLVDAIHAGAKYGHGAKGNSVFVSYRREESAHVAGRIYDHLEGAFGVGNVFFDVEGIPIGSDFRSAIRNALLKSQALVLVMGKQWANRFRSSATWFSWRVSRTIDYVRIEIELALDHNVRILPLLIDGAHMPSETDLPAKISQICYYQAAPIRGGLDFRLDIKRVIEAIRNPPLHATV